MIYNDDFVWLHFPKNAGTKVEKLFARYYADDRSIVQDDLSLKDGHWHHSIREREKKDAGFSLGERQIIVCTRRLPSWLISRYSFEVDRTPDLPHDPELLFEGRFYERGGYLNHADNYVNRYVNEVDPARVRFIRVESFRDDFLAVFGDYIDTDRIPKREFDSRVNTSGRVLAKSFETRLLAEGESLYRHCPNWHRFELDVYGSTDVTPSPGDGGRGSRLVGWARGGAPLG